MTDHIDRQQKHFDGIAETYRTARQHANHILLKSLIWSGFFADKQHLIAKGARVLEPMCGMAEGLGVIRAYAQADVDYAGFDYSEKMVEAARAANPGMHIDFRDVTSFNHTGEPFDLIVLIGGLHHVYKDSARVVRQLTTSLRSGGHFLNFEPTQNCWLTRRVRHNIYRSNPIFDNETERGFELGELNDMFVNAGMSRVDQVYPGLLAYVLYYNPDAFPQLNLGGKTAVKASFGLDRLFWRTWLAKKLSFATITLWQKN